MADLDVNRRLIGSSAIFSASREVTDVDIDGFVRRILLFDQYVLASVRLQEFRYLVRYLRYEGLRDLLATNLLEIRCEWLQFAQVGQSEVFGNPKLPLLTYQFNFINAHDRQGSIEKALQSAVGSSGLHKKHASRLKNAIVEAIRPLPEDMPRQLLPAFLEDVRNETLLRKSVDMMLQKHLGQSSIPFALVVHQEADLKFKVETNLASLTAMSEDQIHKIVEAGLMGVAGLSQAVAEMKVYSALSGFRDDELALFRTKLGFLAGIASSQGTESNFQRAMDIADVPRFLPEHGRLNVDRFLKLRDSSEAREFRDWLSSCGNADVNEIKQRVAGLRARAGLKVGGPTGKALRFLITTASGFGPHGPITGLAVGAFDAFLLDKILHRSGIAAFVNEMYPSIFEEK